MGKKFSKRASITLIDSTDTSILNTNLIAIPSKSQISYIKNSEINYIQDWSLDDNELEISFSGFESIFEVDAPIDILSPNNINNLKNVKWYINSNLITSNYNDYYDDINNNNSLKKYFLSDESRYKYKFNDTEKPTKFTIKSNLLIGLEPVEIKFSATYDSMDSGISHNINTTIEIKLFTGDKNTVYLQLDGMSLIKPNKEEDGVNFNEYAYMRSSIFFNGIYLNDNVNIKYDWYTNNGTTLINKPNFNEIDDDIKSNFVIGNYHEMGSNDLLYSYVSNNLEFSNNNINNFKNGNVIKIHRNSILNYETFKVVVTISDNIQGFEGAQGVYTSWFIITDNSDNIHTQIIPINGDKFKNGLGSIFLKPQLYVNGMIFQNNAYNNIRARWSNYAQNGYKSGFIIKQNNNYFSYIITNVSTSNNSATFTLIDNSPLISNDFDMNTLGKFYDSDGFVYIINGYFDRSDGSSSKAFTINFSSDEIDDVNKIITNISESTFITKLSKFNGNKLHLLNEYKTTEVDSSNTNDSLIIEVHHDDIDTKGSIECDIYLIE